MIPKSPVGFVGVIDQDIIEDKTYTPRASNDLQWFKVSYLIQRLFHSIFRGQVHSQYQFWGGAVPPKCGPFGPKQWTFLNLTPLNPPLNSPSLAHFVTKSEPFGRFGVVHCTPLDPPGYRPV